MFAFHASMRQGQADSINVDVDVVWGFMFVQKLPRFDNGEGLMFEYVGKNFR